MKIKFCMLATALMLSGAAFAKTAELGPFTANVKCGDIYEIPDSYIHGSNLLYVMITPNSDSKYILDIQRKQNGVIYDAFKQLCQSVSSPKTPISCWANPERGSFLLKISDSDCAKDPNANVTFSWAMDQK